MKRLFIIRFILYFIVLLVPLFHPSVPVYLDFPGGWLYWVVIPLAALFAIACKISAPVFGHRYFSFLSFALLILISLFLVGGNQFFLMIVLAGTLVFFLTRLVFLRRLYFLLYIEPVAYYLVMFRMVSFTRILEGESSGGFPLSRVLFLLSCFLFLVQVIWVFQVIHFRSRNDNKRRETVSAIVLSLSLILIAAFLLPENGLEYLQTLNNADQFKKNKPYPLEGDSRLNGEANGPNGTDPGEGSGENGGQGDKPYGNLMGVPAESWSQGNGDGQASDQGENDGSSGGTQNQYLVMVVESPVEPVYLAEEYYGAHNAESGFQIDIENPYNELSRQRFLETWENPNLPEDRGRIPQWINVFSTIPDKSLSWYPFMLEPTVYNSRYYPLIYTYRSFSFISSYTDQLPARSGRVLSTEEKNEMTVFLTLDFDSSIQNSLEILLGIWTEEKKPPGEKIEDILHGFDSYQYQMGFTEDISSDAILKFIFDNKTGDCTEFSHAAAIMGRLAGIPSRVVTGYLVSRGLQTPSHTLGLEKLRQAIPEMAEGDTANQFLVTTAHRHSWVQYYLAGYGWVDFESTRFAIPPPPGLNPNSQDVVIPVITERDMSRHEFVFPWRLLLSLLAGIILLLLFVLYLIRTIRLLLLSFKSRQADEAGVKALYRLCLVRMASRGWKVKAIDQTPEEYARDNPLFLSFASAYTNGLYAGNAADGHERLFQEYQQLMKDTNSLKSTLKEIISLKGWHWL